ncbi:MAG: GNAT family N-acetyltransferase [Roseiflexaceae bacterium]|nr:GNAT family N-acetyltransferase [Roseiflexaceae bacterium]
MITFTIETNPAAQDTRFLADQINAYNIAITGINDWQALAIFVRDETGQIIAGIHGGSWAGYLEIHNLWVHEQLRGQGYGSRLLALAETEARQRDCTQVLLDTHDFQAIDFYKKCGYHVFGSFDGIGGRYTRFYLRKQLSNDQR